MSRDLLKRHDALLAIKDDTRRARGILVYACIAAETGGDLVATLQKAERIGVCPRNLRWTGIDKVTRALLRIRGIESLDKDFSRRLTTYANLADLVRTQQAHIATYRDAVTNRDTSMARAAISVAAVACCAHIDADFPTRVLPELFLGIQQGEDRRATIEVIANAMSMLISDTSQHSPLTPLELMGPVAPYIYSPEFLRIIAASVFKNNILHVRDLVSINGYMIERHEPIGAVIYNLIPGDIGAHRARWLGVLMRHERESRLVPNSTPEVKYSDLARPLQCTLVRAPYPRYRHTVPEMIFFDLYESLAQGRHTEAFRRECLIDVVLDPSTARIGEIGLDRVFADVARLKRMAELSTTLLVCLPRGNRDAILNSLVATFDPEKYSTLVGQGDEGDKTRRSLANLTWDGEPFVDLFYTPIMKIDDHMFISPPIIHAANLQRNLLWRDTKDAKRLGTAAERFPEHIADLLRRGRIGRVTTEKKIKSLHRTKAEHTNLDVVLLHEHTLWFFECKFNLFGATTYEERDLLRDIEKGTSQVTRALRILGSDPERTLSYARSWFPDVRIPRGTRLDLRGGLILSTGEYSGLARDGVPIRDVISLRSTILGGEITWSAQRQGGEEEKFAERFWKGIAFTYDDFLAYWGSSPPVFTRLQDSLVEYTYFARLGPVVEAELRCNLQGRRRSPPEHPRGGP